jgi:hypothetical protein
VALIFSKSRLARVAIISGVLAAAVSMVVEVLPTTWGLSVLLLVLPSALRTRWIVRISDLTETFEID